MGCWNQTCGISGLPILCGDEVISVFLIESRYQSTTSQYHYAVPTPFYFEGEYNDYGAVENEHGVALPFIMSALKRNLLEMPAGENEYHEKAITKDGFDFHKAMEEDHEGRLAIKVRKWSKDEKDSLKVSHIQIRKGIFEQIVENAKVTSWDRETYETIYHSYDEIMDDFNKWYEDAKTSASSGRWSRKLRDEMNWIDKFLNEDQHESNCPLMSGSDVIFDLVDLVEKGECDEDGEPYTREMVYKLVDNRVRLGLVDMIIGHSGKQWIKPGHIGQESDTDAMEMIAGLTISEAEVIRSRWDEEDEEEGEFQHEEV